MVECRLDLDHVFHALADSTRRDILVRVSTLEQSIGELAQHYKMSFAAISKHIGVLARANLILKQRRGKQQIISLAPQTVDFARDHLERYAELWTQRFDTLEHLLTTPSEPQP